MSEPTDAQPTPCAPEAQSDQPQSPPWGDDFDPARAWDKIQKANSEAKGLRDRLAAAEQSQLSDEQRHQLAEFEKVRDAQKSEAQRTAEAIEAANRERDESKAETTRLRVALKHGISVDDFDLLGSGTEEQIEQRAARLAEKNKAVADAMAALPGVEPTPTPTPRRPGEQLKPGAVPTPPPPMAEEEYPASWLSPTQRARVEQARAHTTTP